MAVIRFSMLQSISKWVSPSFRTLVCRGYYDSCMRFGFKVGDPYHGRPLIGCVNHGYHTDSHRCLVNFGSQVHPHLHNQCDVSDSRVRSKIPAIWSMPIFGFQSASSLSGTRGYSSRAPEVPEASGMNQVDVGGDNGVIGSEWVNKLKDGWQSAVDIVVDTVERAKEASAVITPHAQQILDSHPYLKDVVVPVGGTLTATLMAWLVMPKILRRFHKYSTQGSSMLLHGSIFGGEVPYEKSFWGALEDPLRYLITFISFSQMLVPRLSFTTLIALIMSYNVCSLQFMSFSCMLIGRAIMVAPTAIASQYIGAAWRGAIILSFVWFLHRWKTNVLAHTMHVHSLLSVDRERLLTLDRVSSVGLFVIGLMALAEACGVAVQSILTVGGVGGVATAFAARDILGNVLSGLSMQFSRPFSLGDTIKAGSVEGQVVEMGLTTTSLLSTEKFPVIVPNSMFSSQVIINKSRAPWRALATKIPLQFDNLEKIPQVTGEIKLMLLSHAKVFLGKEAPYCYLSQMASSYAELTVGCNLKQMSKDELFATQQDILLRSIEIIKQHGLALGIATYQDSNSQ
ncbi:hypothetical protein Dimus_025290 [Dionaea muscipula]